MSEFFAAPTVWPLGIERIVVAVNPVATTANIASDIEENLRQGGLGKPVVPLETVAGGTAANQEHFARLLEPGDLVVTVTGDGGFREIGAALLHPDLLPYRDNIVLTTVGGGDACDLRHALHGKQRQHCTPPTQLLKESGVVSVHPLEIQMGASWHIAFSYAGFGRTGEAASIVNTDTYRQKPRLPREAGLILRTLCSGSSFRLQSGHHAADFSQSRTTALKELAELTVSISPYMARDGRFPIRHWDDDMYVMPIRPGLLRPAAGLIALASGRPFGTYRSGKQPLQFTLAAAQQQRSSTVNPYVCHQIK